MDPKLAVILVSLLGETINSEDRARRGHPSSRSQRQRAQAVAESEAVRHLFNTSAFMASLHIGLDAFEREMRYFGPLSLLNDPVDQPADPSNVRVDR